MWNPLLDATIPIGDQVDAIDTVIVPRARDLGGFEVRRADNRAQINAEIMAAKAASGKLIAQCGSAKGNAAMRRASVAAHRTRRPSAPTVSGSSA